MAAAALYLFNEVEDQAKFVDNRFYKSILLMKSITPNSAYMADPQPVPFAVYSLSDSTTDYVCLAKEEINDAIMSAMNLKLVRKWQLIRRGEDIHFIGECSESVVADNIVPHEIKVEGIEDAERCWAISLRNL